MVSARSPGTGRNIPLLDIGCVSQKPALRMARQPAKPFKTIRGIRLSRRFGAQLRGIKKALARAGATTNAGGKKEQDLAAPLWVSHGGKVGPQAQVRGPKDSERLRALRHKESSTPPSERYRH